MSECLAKISHAPPHDEATDGTSDEGNAKASKKCTDEERFSEDAHLMPLSFVIMAFVIMVVMMRISCNHAHGGGAKEF